MFWIYPQISAIVEKNT